MDAQPLSGRHLRFLVGSEGAGGTETYARMIAKHIGLALPNVSMSVELVPEADGRLAAKRIAEAAAGDLTIGLFEPALLYSEVEKDDLAPISLADFNWVGKLAVDERIMIGSTKSGILSLDALKARDGLVVSPVSTIVSRGASECLILDALLGLSIRPVPGYDGAQRSLAMLNGEGQVVVGSYASQTSLIEQDAGRVLLRLNAVPHPLAPATAPLLRDLLDERDHLVVDLIEAGSNLGRWIAAPPGIAAGDLDALRATFDRAVASEGFKDEMRKNRLAIEPLGGAEVQDNVRRLLSRKAEIRVALIEALQCGRARSQGARAC